MAMVECWECGQQISSHAPTCPSCGAPPKPVVEHQQALQAPAQYGQAVALVKRDGRASISFLQRHLQIGYAAAARIIERMEREGIVGRADHTGYREVIGARGTPMRPPRPGRPRSASPAPNVFWSVFWVVAFFCAVIVAVLR